MKKETLIWSLVLLAGVLLLVVRAAFTEHGMGKAYERAETKSFANVASAGEKPKWVDVNSDNALDYDMTVIPEDQRISWDSYSSASYRQFQEQQSAAPGGAAAQNIKFSWRNTIGIWIAAFFTLAIFSFLYKDNPFYKIAEAVVVGVSAAYWMVVGFWDVIIPNLIGKLHPPAVTSWALPGLSGADLVADYFYVFPLILGIMLLWRLAPKGTWIARWPLAFIIGTTAGLRLVGFIQADFLSQIRNTINSLVVAAPQKAADGAVLLDAAGQPVMGFEIWDSLANVIIIVGVLACLVYFFFSFEHKGIMGRGARLGIWFLMITFGAGFGYTVMGRIALLAIRIEFLFDDWLWLIDPTDKRAVIGLIMLPFS